MNELKKNMDLVKYYFEESLLTYNDSSTLRLSILGIPIIGNIIDTIITTKAQSISHNRLLSFLNEVDNKIRNIDERLIDLEFIKSEEFYDLLLKIFEIVIKTHHDEKRKLLVNFLLKNVLLNDKIEEDYNSLLIKYIDELTVTHLSILLHLQTKIEEYKSLKKYEDLYQDYCNANSITDFDKSYFRALVKDLENKTLCRFSKNVDEYGSTGGYTEAEDSKIVPGVQITNLGNEIINLIKNDAFAV